MPTIAETSILICEIMVADSKSSVRILTRICYAAVSVHP